MQEIPDYILLRKSFNPLNCWRVVTNLDNIMGKKLSKWLKPWQTGTHLRVLSKSFPMNTNMTGFRQFSKISSVRRVKCVYPHSPNAHTSDLLLNLVYTNTSGGAHLIGNLLPEELVYSSSITCLEKRNKHIKF